MKWNLFRPRVFWRLGGCSRADGSLLRFRSGERDAAEQDALGAEAVVLEGEVVVLVDLDRRIGIVRFGALELAHVFRFAEQLLGRTHQHADASAFHEAAVEDAEVELALALPERAPEPVHADAHQLALL